LTNVIDVVFHEEISPLHLSLAGSSVFYRMAFFPVVGILLISLFEEFA
jgi:hypothetical protein